MLQRVAKGNISRLPRSTSGLAHRPRAFTTTLLRRAGGPPKGPLTSGSSHQTNPTPPVVQKIQHSPISPTNAGPFPASQPLPPPPGFIPPSKPKRRLFRFRNIFTLLLLSTLGYGGAVWYSFQSDNFHDFFTEYVPGSSQCIQAVQDYEFSQRYPGSSVTRKPGEKISELGRKGPHMSALGANRPEVIEQKKEEAKKEQAAAKKKNEEEKQGKGKGKSQEEQKGPEIKLISHTDTTPQTSEQSKKNVSKEPPAKRDPEGTAPQTETKPEAKPLPLFSKKSRKTTKATPAEESKPADSTTAEPVSQRLQIDPLQISPNHPSLEKLTTALNDLINSFNSTPTYDSSSASLYEFLKSSVADLNSNIPDLITSTRAEAESQIQAQAQYFTRLHDELQTAMIQERNAIANEWMTAFDRERDTLQQRYNERLAEELNHQTQVNNQRLENELLEQAIALRRRWLREIQTQVETERGGRLGKLEGLQRSLSELANLHQDSHEIFSKGEKSKKKAIAIQALKDAALNQNGSFISELAALKTFSHHDDLVRSLIATIDPDAYTNGIATQADLAVRFQTLSMELRKIALLPPDAGVAGHATSWILSKLMFRQKGYVAGDDVESRLARVEALLESGKLEDATREVNSFEGWGRELSRDWLREARKRLEVVQAIDVLETQTALDALESV